MNLRSLSLMKKNGKKITMLTCYDATFASILESVGIDAILVGDSLGIVIKGDSNTHNVSLDDMLYHTKAVSQGLKSTFIISDLPIGTYKTTELAYQSALRLIEAGAHMVKLEGDTSLADTIRHLKVKGISVCAHIGLMPQNIKDCDADKIKEILKNSSEKLLEDAKALEKSGADMIVLSSISEDIAKKITLTLSIPTIGFNTGKTCDGEVFILYDLLMQPQRSHHLYLENQLSHDKINIVQDFLMQFIKDHS
ncbi:MAG: 3-methyl-2-oxobutanoate hydroxymethyltransferase [Candidatus Methylopumilus sp.]|nr:3-methyl-2-oxobutanoate hydroxymethyltransferase [Candidatus Methylopumilus sp.]